MVVHCSAGIGRTGTFIGLDVATKLYDRGETVDVNAVVNRLRDDRGGLVQHAAQLAFMHASLTQYALAMTGKRPTPSPIVTEVMVGDVSVSFSAVDGDGDMNLAEAVAGGMPEETFNLIDSIGTGRITREYVRLSLQT